MYASLITARSLARIDKELDEHERALATLVWARGTMAELLRHDPDNLLWRDQATRIEVDLAELFLARGEEQKARAAFAQARRLLKEGNEKGAESSQQRKALESRLGALALLMDQEHDMGGLNNVQ